MGRKIALAEAREINPHEHLVIYCAGTPATGAGCRHSGEMSLLHAISLWGEDVRLDDLPLKCSRCGSRAVDVRTDHPRNIGGNPI